HVGYVGQVRPVMLVFLANAEAASPVAPAAAPPSRFPDLHFPRVFGNQQQQPITPAGGQGAPPAAAQPPNQMPQVPSQPLNPANPALRQTGGQMPLNQPALRLPGTEAADRVPIDWRQLQVRRDG